MTRKIIMNGDEPSEGAERGSASLADQWIEKNWYLPPSGDHSWREREAQRMFGSGQSVNDEAETRPAEEAGPAANEVDGRYVPVFKRAWALNILLPLSVAMCVVFVVVAMLVPGILTSSNSGPREPKAAPSDTPLRLIDETRAQEHVTPRTVERGLDQPRNETVTQALPQPLARPVPSSNVDRKIALPHLRAQMPVIAKHQAQSGKRAIRVAKAKAAGSPSKPTAKSLPPIGEAYFASHARAAAASKPDAVSARPIGQAYFEGRSRTAAD